MKQLKKILKTLRGKKTVEPPVEVVKEENIKKTNPALYYSELTDTKDWKYKYNYYRRTQNVEQNWVLYESHAGAGMLCNPLALFKEFKNRDDFADYLHVWVIADDSEIEYLRNEYKDFSNVLFVKYNTIAYAYFVAKAKYLINNTSFTSFFSKREEQIFLNTWHSITVKSLGYDTPDGVRIVKNMLRNLLASDYIISPNEFMTGIFDNSFRLREICQGKYIEEGYPRNDMVINTAREEILKKLSDHGTKIDPDKKIILYAPTWSGNNASAPEIDMSKYTDLYSHLCKNIDLDEYQIIIKPHHVVYRRLSEAEQKSGMYVSYNIDANELLSIVDILVTDYSSIYFDYLVADKPILFYIPDFEKYQETRGIYFTVDELPGPCAKTLDELSDYVNNIEQVKENYKQILDETRGWACKYDDGNVSKRILNIVFDGNQNYNIKEAHKTGKKTILFYPGMLATNGVTSAFLCLLNNIDYDKYDVTVFALASKYEEPNINLDRIPSHIRTFLRVSTPPLSSKEKPVYERGLKFGYLMEEKRLEVMKRIMKREYTRIFGNAKFDYIIDYSGYGIYFPMLATLGCEDPDTKKFIWQHSDLAAEFANEEKRRINKATSNIETLLSCYQGFDKIVSSTESVCEINRENLSTEETYEKFSFATNLLDKERFERLAADTTCYVQDKTLYVENEAQPSGFKNLTIIPLKENCIKFVTMGRIMPEKNQRNIISAVKRLNDEGVNAVLYIIGDGPLREQVEYHAKELGVEDKIVLTGIMHNPLALLKQCDCFVFPSFYEAQGLAVLEARIAKLPIIVSNFKAVKSVLIDDKQYVLKGFEADDIYEGMKAYINGEIPTDYNMDIDAYNKKAVNEFDNLFN